MKAADFFSEAQKKQIVQCIADAELQTSGEIRLHLEDHCDKNPYDRALELFQKLNMHQTKLRNGVLLYIAVKDKKLAILGDEGIHKIVQQNFWDRILHALQNGFKQEQYYDSICSALAQIGLQLKTHFPLEKNDQDELTNDISIG